MEKVIHDSGVIRVLMRTIINDIDKVPPNLAWWRRTYETEPYRFAQGLASSADGGVGKQETINYWYSKTLLCMEQGIALALFVGSKVNDEWKYGPPSGGLLAMPDSTDRGRCVLEYCAGNAFADNSRETLLMAGREWATAMGRRLESKKVTVEWLPV